MQATPSGAAPANVDVRTVEGFGDEWDAYDQTALDPAEHRRLFDEYFSTFPFQMFGLGAADDLTRPGDGHRGDTVIGNDVWIGREAVIMPGVTVGDGAIIGARAQVCRDAPPYSVVVGNPGRVVKLRFPPDIVDELLAIAWWRWDAEKIARNLGAITSADIDARGRPCPRTGLPAGPARPATIREP